MITLVVKHSFQNVDYICFCIDWKKLDPELYFEL